MTTAIAPKKATDHTAVDAVDAADAVDAGDAALTRADFEEEASAFRSADPCAVAAFIGAANARRWGRGERAIFHLRLQWLAQQHEGDRAWWALLVHLLDTAAVAAEATAEATAATKATDTATPATRGSTVYEAPTTAAWLKQCYYIALEIEADDFGAPDAAEPPPLGKRERR